MATRSSTSEYQPSPPSTRLRSSKAPRQPAQAAIQASSSGANRVKANCMGKGGFKISPRW